MKGNAKCKNSPFEPRVVGHCSNAQGSYMAWVWMYYTMAHLHYRLLGNSWCL